MKKTSNGKIIIIITAVCVLLTVAVVLGASYIIKHRAGDVAGDIEPLNYEHQDRIQADVWEQTPDENGRRMIYVNRHSIPNEKIDEAFYQRYGFAISDYDDMETYENKTQSALIEKIKEKYGWQDTEGIPVTPENYKKTTWELFEEYVEKYGEEQQQLVQELLSEYEEKIAKLDEELSEDMNEFIMNSRAVIKELYCKYNDDFFERNSIDIKLVSYNGWYTGSIIMYADEKMIRKIAEDESVMEVARWNEGVMEND